MDGNISPPKHAKKRVGEPENAVYSPQVLENHESLPALLQTAIHRLIYNKKRATGIKILQSSLSPPLIELAPVVFNMRYLAVS